MAPMKLARGKTDMDKAELTEWALKSGWQIIAGHPSLTKPSSPKEAIVRMVFKTTVVNLEVKKARWQMGEGRRPKLRQDQSRSGIPDCRWSWFEYHENAVGKQGSADVRTHVRRVAG